MRPSPMTRLLANGLLAAMIGLPACTGAGDPVCDFGDEVVRRQTLQTPNIQVEVFHFPRPGSSIHDPAVAPDGRIWYTDTWNSCVGVLDPATGRLEDHPAMSEDAGPHGLGVGAGAVWYAATATGRIGRLDLHGGEHRDYELADGPIDPHTILVRRDRVWFTAPRANRYGYVDSASGEVRLFDLPIHGAQPYDIAADAGGDLWLSLGGTPHLAHISSATGSPTLVELPVDARPLRVSIGPNGDVWYTDRGAPGIGRLDPKSGRVRHVDATSRQAYPSVIVADETGVWYYEEGAAELVWMIPECGFRTVIDLGALGAVPRHMVLDTVSSAIWMALGDLPGLARVSPVIAPSCS